MNTVANLLVALAMGLNLFALGRGRLAAIIGLVATQGVVLGLLPLVLEPRLTGLVALMAGVTLAVKGVLIPWLLRRAMRTAKVDTELQPLLGFAASVCLGVVGMIGALIGSRWLPLLPEHAGTLLVPGALATIFTGFILLVGRTKAIAQVCGYLVLENGIYLFGLLLLRSTPLLVESGILLDLTVGVFVIGIMIDRILRAFDSLDTRKLTALRE